MDVPDPDVIRVGEKYYMVSTTMHFFPGCQILESDNLVNWKHHSYVYENLEDSDELNLMNDRNAYGKGMWAATIRFHNNRFHILFVANDSHKTYLLTSVSINGPWKMQTVEGFYHDASLLFDDDGKVYIVYGNTEIHLTELDETLTGPKKNGLDRIIFKAEGNKFLGYEGSHIYKINSCYYVFVIHSLNDRWRRVESCFQSDSLDKEFRGEIIFNDDLNFFGSGIAQGGIVDTPDGKYYSIMFQDRGAAGRFPVLVPVKYENNKFIFGDNGKMPEIFEVNGNTENNFDHRLFGNDNFNSKKLKPFWQFNHVPEKNYISFTNGSYSITTHALCQSILSARNTLTQRLPYPAGTVKVTVDVNSMNTGDIAGLSIFQDAYGFIAIHKTDEANELVMAHRTIDNGTAGDEIIEEKIVLSKNKNKIELMAECDFTDMKDTAKFYYRTDGQWKMIGTEHKMYFSLKHFCGNRAALFHYSTKKYGGTASFKNFTNEKK